MIQKLLHQQQLNQLLEVQYSCKSAMLCSWAQVWQCTVLLKKSAGIPMHRVLGVFRSRIFQIIFYFNFLITWRKFCRRVKVQYVHVFSVKKKKQGSDWQMIKVYMRAFQFKVTALEMAHYQTNTHVIDPGTMSKKDYREGHGCCNVSFAFSSVDLHISEGKAHFVLQVVSRKVKLLVQLIFMLQEMSRN